MDCRYLVTSRALQHVRSKNEDVLTRVGQCLMYKVSHARSIKVRHSLGYYASDVFFSSAEQDKI